MIEIIANSFSEYKAPLLISIFIFACSKYYQEFSPQVRSLDVPSVGGTPSPYGVEFCTSILEGTRKTGQYRDKVFKLDTSNYETVIVPARFIDELKSAPESSLNLETELYERQLGRYTLVSTAGRGHGFVSAIREDLDRNLSTTLRIMLAEVEYATESSIGPAPTWKLVPVHSAALRMVALCTGRAFVGLPLSRNDAWINTSVELTVNTFVGAFALWRIHWTLRPVAALLMPQIWRIHRRNREVAALLKPYLEQRLRDMKDAKFQRPADILQLFLNTRSRHEHMGPLREEVTSVLKSYGGILDQNALTRMRKMDSLLRESQRLNTPGVVSMARKVESDTILSNGTLLPKNCLTACNSFSETRDPKLWGAPEKFDGFRFVKLQDIPGNENKYQFVSTSPTYMAFGHGAHSCAGRFFVANEIKILLAHIIRHYDVKLKDGEVRPPNSYHNVMIIPDLQAELLFRSRLPEVV